MTALAAAASADSAGSPARHNQSPSAKAGDSNAPGAADSTRPAAPSRKRFVIIGVAIVLAVAGTAYWLHSRHFEDTDDAQIDGNISNVSARVSGTVLAVNVVENQRIKAGDVIAEIDPTDLQIELDQAKAQATLDEVTLKRQADLRARNVIAQQDYDTAVANAAKSKAAAEAARPSNPTAPGAGEAPKPS